MTNEYHVQFKNESIFFVSSDYLLSDITQILEHEPLIIFNEGVFRTEAIECVLTLDAWSRNEADEDYQELEDEDVAVAMAEAYHAREAELKLKDKIEALAKSLFQKQPFAVVTDWDEIPEALKAIFRDTAHKQLS